jgi:hypothetical protein
MKPNKDAAKSASIGCPIATTGEVFAGGAMIELVGGVHPARPQLMLLHESKEVVGPVVEYNGQLYEPAQIDSSILEQMTLPACCRPHGTTREFLSEVCSLMTNLVGLGEKSSSLAARIVLLSGIVDALPIAPALAITGPDIERARRLVNLLRCLCWHSVPMTSVTSAGFRSLASGVRFTFIISQTSVSDKLRTLLDDSSNRDRKIPFRGRFLDLFGVQVIHSDSFLAADSWPLRSIQISATPTEVVLPAFDQDVQRRISTEFQAKLLSFRRSNRGAADRLSFDASKFSSALRDLSRSLAAATPDDSELQGEVFELLREEDAESRSARWTDLRAVTVEAVLVAWKESPGEAVYVSELSNLAQAILSGRGEDPTIDPGAIGKSLKALGFATEPRDAKGRKLRLSEAVHEHALRLARDLDIPGPEVGSFEVSQQR